MSFEPGADQAGPRLTPAQQAIQILALRLPKRREFGGAGAGISPLVGAEAGPPTGAASPSAVVQSILRTLLGPQAGAGPVQAAAATVAPVQAPTAPMAPVRPAGQPSVRPTAVSGQPSSYTPPPGAVRPPVVIPGAPPPRPLGVTPGQPMARPPVVIAGGPQPPPPSVTAPSLSELPAPVRPQVNLEDLIGALINVRRRQPGGMA